MTAESCSPKHNDDPGAQSSSFFIPIFYSLLFPGSSWLGRSIERTYHLPPPAVGLVNSVLPFSSFVHLLPVSLLFIANRDANWIEADDHDERR